MEVSKLDVAIVLLGVALLIWAVIDERVRKPSSADQNQPTSREKRQIDNRIAGGLAAAWGIFVGIVSVAMLAFGIARQDAGFALGLIGLAISVFVTRWGIRRTKAQ